MANAMETSTGEGVESVLTKCLYNTFKEKVANDIYSKLEEEGIDDLQTLVLSSEKDLDDLCNDMKLRTGKKMKFKAMIRKKQYQQHQQHQKQQNSQKIVISMKEQSQMNKVQQTLEQCRNMENVLESYSNQVEKHCTETKSQIEELFETAVVEILKRKQTALKTQVEEWKSKTLEQTNEEVSKIATYSADLKQSAMEINKILHDDTSAANNEREFKIVKMAQNICDNHQYYQTFHRLKLLEEYVESNTKLIQMQVNEERLNDLIVFEETPVNICDFKLPSVILTGVEAIRQDFVECKYNVNINWHMDQKIVSNKQDAQDIQLVAEYRSVEDETDNEDEKKQEDAQKSCWKSMALRNMNTLSDDRFSAELPDYFVFDTTYNVRIAAKIKNVLLFNIQSNIKTIAMTQQPIPLQIHSATAPASDYEDYAAQNILNSKSNAYYITESQPAFVIFDSKDINIHYIPTKVTLSAGGTTSALQDFNVWIGNAKQDKWIKCNKSPLTLPDRSCDQSFEFDYVGTQNIDTLNQIQSHQYTQYKLEMLNNREGGSTSIFLHGFKLFGIK
eukprot:1045590_1